MENLPTTNNNPGDLRNVGQLGASDGAGGFAKFENPQSGFGALLNDLQTKITNHPNWTLADFSNVYAPPSDDNNSAQYAANLANQLGVAPNTPISSLRGNIGHFAEAVAANEGYQGKLPLLESSPNNVHQPDPNASGGSSILDQAEAIGAGILGWGTSQLGNIAKIGLPLAGAALGGLIDPVGGEIVGGMAGEGLANVIGGGGDGNKPPTESASAVPAPSEQPPQDTAEAKAGESSNAARLVSDAINQSLQGTQAGRVFSQSQKGQDAIQTAAMFGLISPDQGGIMQVNKDKRQEALGVVSNLDDKAIAADGGSAPMMFAANEAGKYIGNSKLHTDEDKQMAGKRASEIIRSEGGGNLNRSVPLTTLREKLKQHNQKWGKEGYKLPTSEILAHRAVAHAYGEAITHHLKDEGSKKLHEQAMKMESHLIRTRQLDKLIQGKKAPRNKGIWESFLRQGARAAEIYIGDRLGGPIGAIIGGIVGESFNRKLDQRFGRNIFETKGMKAALDILKDVKPKEYNDLVAALKQKGIQVQSSGGVPTTPEGLVKDVAKDEGIIGVPSKEQKPKSS